MIERIVVASTSRPRLVLVLSLLVAVLGVLAWRASGRDAVVDLSDPQIVVVVDWMGHPADEVASEVTRALTADLGHLPRVTAVRGSSMSGMAYVDVVFEAGANLDTERAAVAERVARATLPENARAQVGPAASSTGWIFEYALVDPRRRQSGVALRRFQEDVLRPALGAIPGVAEVASVGGNIQQVLVELEADRLSAHGVAYSDAVAVLRQAVKTHAVAIPNDLAAVPIPIHWSGSPEPIRLRDVGHVHVTDDMPTGLADFRGIQPAIGGIVIAQRDAHVPEVIARVRAELERLRPAVPPGAELVIAYDRSDLVTRVERTLLGALAEEVTAVVLVTLLFLWHGRSALLPLVTLPFVVLLTLLGMWVLRVPASIMSLGGIGIALGIAVDADLVALEACHRRLEGVPSNAPWPVRRAQVVAAAGALTPAILTSLFITALAFLPVLAFDGESGRLLRPLAISKTLVVVAAGLVSLTTAPALRQSLLTGGVPHELDNPVTRALVGAYRPFVHFALSRPALTLVTATLAVISAVPVSLRLGAEFLPRIDEGDLLAMPTTLPGVAPDQAATDLFRQDRAMRAFPEVTGVFGKVGRADTATDPAPYAMVETVIRLAPRDRWPLLEHPRWYSRWAPSPLRRVLAVLWPEARRETMSELVDRLDQATRLPGWTSAWTAPARARLDMMATGVRTPLAIRVVAADPTRLDALGTALREIVARVPGARGAAFESQGGEVRLDFEPDDAALARLHVDPERARAAAHLVLTGGQIGEMNLDGRQVRLRVAPDENMHAMMMPGPGEPLRGAADQLREATVRADNGGPPVPLALLGRARYVRRPAQLRTERGEQVAYVHVDLSDGTDPAGFVQRAQREIDRAAASGEAGLRPGERVEWAGQYELWRAGRRRLLWIAPLVLASMLALLWLQFRSLPEALIVLASVPFALVGSAWTLWLLSYPMSAPVWVGLLSTVGLAVQTGVVMVVYIDEAFYRRVREGRVACRDDIVEAHAEGTVRRLRPKVMTVTTMAASLLPLLWAEGGGAEIMKRLAAPMLGGLVTSAVLTLEVLPVLYTLWRTAQLRRAQRLGVPLAAVLGTSPAWARAPRASAANLREAA